jgi:hypothetical protein
MVATEIAGDVSPRPIRRAVRHKLDVPLRVIVQKHGGSVIRDGRGTELSECGMRVMAGVELNVGEGLEIEFTLPYSSEPIRVSGAVRNRVGYRYGCEFIMNGLSERKDVARLRQALQTLGALL